MSKSIKSEIKNIIKRALEEDIGTGDATSCSVLPEKAKVKARIISKGFGIAAGIDVARVVFEAVDKRIKVKAKVKDGSRIFPGRTLMTIEGPARSVLSAERTALNFLQRMSGIATATRAFVNKVRLRKTKILATRKTAPGLRLLDKYAVMVGGGLPHRTGLYDAILIKENHIAVAGSMKKAVSMARKNAPPEMGIEVEAGSLKEVKAAINAGANKILLDNMSPIAMALAVKLVRKHNETVGVPQADIKTEASGGVTLKNVSRIARTGVDAISVGALTHSPKALDMSLEIY